MTRRMLVAALAAAFTLLAPAAAQAGSHITWTPERLTVTTDGAGDVVSLYTREISGVVYPAFTTGGPTTYTQATPTEGGCIEDAGYIVCDGADSFLFQGGGGTDTLSISDELGAQRGSGDAQRRRRQRQAAGLQPGSPHARRR